MIYNSKKTKIKYVLVCVLSFCLLGLSIGLAKLSSTFTLEGEVSTDALRWDVRFDSITTSNNNNASGNNPSISGPNVSGLNVTFNGPGSWIEYNIVVHNYGNSYATLSQFAVNTNISCDSGNSDYDDSLCSYITYEVKSGGLDYPTIHTDGNYDEELGPGESKTISVRYYFDRYYEISNFDAFKSTSFTVNNMSIGSYYVLGKRNDDVNNGYTGIVMPSIFDNYMIETNPEFESRNGLFLMASTQNDEYPIYYYKGSNVNNTVIFNYKCWSIVRTTDHGGLKLIHVGRASNGKCTDLRYYEYGTNYYGYGYGYIGNRSLYYNNTFLATNRSFMQNEVNYLGDEGYMRPADNNLLQVEAVNINNYNGNYYSSGDELITIPNNSSFYAGNMAYYDTSAGKFRFHSTYSISTADLTGWDSYFDSTGISTVLRDFRYTCFKPTSSGDQTCDELYYIVRYQKERGIVYSNQRSKYQIVFVKIRPDVDFRSGMWNEYTDYRNSWNDFNNSVSSAIKLKLEQWYQNNFYVSDVIGDDYVDYDEIYCNDRRLINYYAPNLSRQFAIEFAGSERLLTNKSPSLTCSRAMDSFSAGTLYGGNGLLSKPIGLLTGDELFLASERGNPTKSYIYTYGGIPVTLTPLGMFRNVSLDNPDGSYYGIETYSGIDGSNWSNYFNSSSSNGSNNYSNGKYRAVVTIKKGYQFLSGDGSIDRPYIISYMD